MDGGRFKTQYEVVCSVGSRIDVGRRHLRRIYLLLLAMVFLGGTFFGIGNWNSSCLVLARKSHDDIQWEYHDRHHEEQNVELAATTSQSQIMYE
jgi:hypothetical protein